MTCRCVLKLYLKWKINLVRLPEFNNSDLMDAEQEKTANKYNAHDEGTSER